MYIKRKSSTMKQMAYAKRILGGQGVSKQQIALDSGYSPNVARSVASHIEHKPGFNNAMAALAVESNNLALAAMHEFKARGFEDFSNKELVGALNAIGSAWSRFNVIPKEKGSGTGENKLRTLILQQVEHQTMTQAKNDEVVTEAKEPEKVEPVENVSDPLDF